MSVPKKEVTVKSETLYEGNILTLKRDTVIAASGDEATREIVYHSGGVGIVAITSDNKIVLVKQYRIALDDFILEIPAGKLEMDEDIFKAAERELKEETGYSADKIEFLGEVLASPGFLTEKVSLFLATGLTQGECSFDKDEDIETIEISFDEAVKMAVTGEIKDAKSVSGILKAYIKG